MREIKFRYIYKNKLTKKIRVVFKTLDELEEEGFMLGFVYELLSRDEYIGLKDKNDKEVYEGDIVNTGGTSNGKVVYELCEFLVRFGDLLCRRLDIDIENEIEVIGNIHENPELLEVK